MSNIIRRLCLFFILSSLFLSSGCGLVVINYDKFGDDSSESTEISTDDLITNAPEETVVPVTKDYTNEIKANLATIPDEKYQSTVFKIVSPDTSSLNGDGDMAYISEIVHARNERISAKHSVSVVAAQVDYLTLFEDVSATANSGMYYADLLMIPQEMVGSLAINGLLVNLRSMSSFDFEADYFNESAVAAGAAGFNSYAVGGYASIYPYSLPVVYFNKDLCDSAGVDMYTLVKTGEWTWDKFFTIAYNATNKDGVFSWGTTGMGDAVYESVFVSCGHRMVNSGVMKVPSLAFTAEETANTVNILQTLYNDKNSVHTNEDSVAYFAEGNGYFLFEKLSAVTTLSTASADWGIVPLPKASADGSYQTLAGTNSLLFACPSTVTTPDKSATVMMSLNAASEGIIKDAYINHIQYTYLRDNQSANMLDHVLDNIVYDFSYTYGNRYDAIASGTYWLVRQAAVPGENMAGLINARSGNLDRIFNTQFGLSN